MGFKWLTCSSSQAFRLGGDIGGILRAPKANTILQKEPKLFSRW